MLPSPARNAFSILVQVLRRHRRAVAGVVLADEVGVSLRTLYRDIEALRAQGAPIDGEAGVGYVLRPGFMLPPLMFTEDEIEALVLGSRWVSERADGPLGKAARNVLAKIGAVLPDDRKDDIALSGLLIGPGAPIAAGDAELATIRHAIRSERKMRIDYADEHGRTTKRTIWPFVLAFHDRVRVVVAWCELRDGSRRLSPFPYRPDHDARRHARALPAPPCRPAALLKEWQMLRGIPKQ